VRDGGPRWIRLRRRSGGEPVDEPTGEWTLHDEYDLAATPCDIDFRANYVLRYQEEEFFSDKWPPGYPPAPGARAYFIGLLPSVSSLGDAGIPMVRGAIVGATYVPALKILDKDAKVERLQPPLHLVDCYSRSGFSGSPVYVETLQYRQFYDKSLPQDKQFIDADFTIHSALFGILIGHLPDVKLHKDEPDKNAGIGLVVPVGGIRQLLDYPKLREFRDQSEREHQRRKREGRDGVGIADSGTHDEGRS
jgi:hypothetical protein